MHDEGVSGGSDSKINHMTLRKKVATGFKWNTFAQILHQTVQLITTAILARLLFPSDYGLMGMVMILMNFINIFRGLGTSAAIIQQEIISANLISSIFWMNLGFGIISTVLIYISSPVIANFFHEDRLILVLRVISIIFTISSISIVQQAILEREFKFSRLVKVELISAVLSAFIGITLAVLHFGVWSLVYKSLAEVTASSAMLWYLTKWRPKMIFDTGELKSVLGYSSNLTGFNITNYFSRNSDNMIIGKFLGAADLGYYSIAYRLMFFPMMNISSVIGRVTFPAFSRVKDDIDKVRTAYLNLVSSIALITFPLMLGLMAVNKLFVLTIFGPKWGPVSTLLLILAPVGLFQSVQSTTGMIYQVKGRTDIMFRWGLLFSFVTIVAFFIGVRWGIYGVATAYAIAVLLMAYPSLFISLRLFKISVFEFVNALTRPLICSVIMALIVYRMNILLPIHDSKPIYLFLLISAGIIIYGILSWFINRQIILAIAEMIGFRIKSIDVIIDNEDSSQSKTGQV